MATWKEFASHVRDNYKILKEDDGQIHLAFGLNAGRSQLVVLWHMQIAGAGGFVQIESPIGAFSPEAVAAAVKETEHAVLGGIGCSGDLLTFRHAVPLENFDTNEFEDPVRMVVTTADQLEKSVFGADKF